LILATLAATGLISNTSRAQVTELVSLGQGGVQGNADVSLPPPGRFVSSDGRFVLWMSYATNFVGGDTNNTWDIFLRDRAQGTTERVNLDSNGNQGNGISGVYGFCISADGRFAAFESASNNLVPGDTNGAREVFLRDRLMGTTERIALTSGGAEALGPSFYPSLSADGRFISFTSPAANLVPGDANGRWDTFVRDRLNGTTERVSVTTVGVEGNNDSYKSEISADGRFVAFESLASNLVAGDTNAAWDVFVHDRVTGVTELASVSTAGVQGNSTSWIASLSGDGRYAVFQSDATNLVPSDTNGAQDIFVRDRLAGTTERVSVSTAGVQASTTCAYASITTDGRYVSFSSGAGNLVPGDTNGGWDTFLRDLLDQTTERLSLTTAGQQVSAGAAGTISGDGRYVVFLSAGSDLVTGDTNGHTDLFLHDRLSAGFTSLCDPGANNVIDCPCGNPPSGLSRGCDNGSSTGGATLSAAGIAYLSMDSLVLTTSGERPNAPSILLQGDSLILSGITFGHGVRCAGGVLKRLFVRGAVNGSITVPDITAGDPTISARSALLGVPIQPGQPYFYLAYYRDPGLLGGCAAASGFNATQTGSVTWWP
jgi:hypothetical protein